MASTPAGHPVTTVHSQGGPASRPSDRLRAPGEVKTRYHAFDALRGIAMFLVIGLHAALGYTVREIPSVLWCVRDTPTVPAFDWFCLWTMGISNPLYFTIAGFFAVSLYDGRGLRGFLENRARRVLYPYLVGVVTVLPACLVVWIFGWLETGRCSWRQALKLRFKDPVIESERFGSGHLWFLEYLVVLLLIYGLVRWWSTGRERTAAVLRGLPGAVLASRWRPFLLAVPTTFLLLLTRERNGVDAVLDRHNAFLIEPLKFLHHSIFFVAGVSLYALRKDLTSFARLGPLYLAGAFPVFAVRVYLLGRDWVEPLKGWERVGLAVSGALFSWLAVFGLIGLALRVVKRSSPAVLYLGDSSYWIYLIHMPILGLIQVDLYQVPGHAAWKAPLVLVSTLAIGFATYHTLVRYTPIGNALHGKRSRPAAPHTA